MAINNGSIWVPRKGFPRLPNVIGEKAFLKVPWIAITPCVLYRHAMALSFVSMQALSNGGVQLFPPVHVRGNEPACVPGSVNLQMRRRLWTICFDYPNLCNILGVTSS